MTAHNHSIVWIDHREARVFHFCADEVETLIVRPNDPDVHIHHKANTIGSGHTPGFAREGPNSRISKC